MAVLAAPPTSTAAHTMGLDEAITSRHSSRLFQPKPVPKEAILSALRLATHSPSNSNIQPWRLYILTGAALERLRKRLEMVARSSGSQPAIPPLPPQFAPLRSELGRQVYGADGMGLAHDDIAGRREAVLRNFDFFGAPLAVIVCMDAALSHADSLSVGMYLQTFLLALTEQGVDSCVEVSVTGYPDVIREEVGIRENMRLLCGVAVGYEVGELRVNHLRTRRLAFEDTTVMIDI